MTIVLPKMCTDISLCMIEDYEWMNRKCAKSCMCPLAATIFTGFSAACTTFGYIGMYSNTSPSQAYSILFIFGLMGDSIVIPTAITYFLGCMLSDCYTLPTKVPTAKVPTTMPGSITGSPKPKIRLADSSSPIEIESPIKMIRSGGASPQRKRSISR